jgi:hypothetical protein
MHSEFLKNRLFLMIALAFFLSVGTAASALAGSHSADEAKEKAVDAAAPLCFDMDIGQPVPCTDKHKEEADDKVRDFMTPHSGERDQEYPKE